jgi:hypothetical protein
MSADPSTTAPSSQPAFDADRQLAVIRRALARNSFLTLATASADGRPHSVGLMYAAVDLTLYALVGDGSVKVRNIRQNPRVAVTVPVRRGPFGPPMAVQFQGTAQVLPHDDPEVRGHLAAGRLKSIARMASSAGPGTCFLRISPGRRIGSYGLGMSLRTLLRDVTQGARSVALP